MKKKTKIYKIPNNIQLNTTRYYLCQDTTGWPKLKQLSVNLQSWQLFNIFS